MTDTKDTTSRQSEGLSLSATQLAGSVLAAVSASVAASVFGVAGTVIGAALGSIISVVGSAVYSYSLRRTQERVRSTLDLAVARRFDVKGGPGSAVPESTESTVAAPSAVPDPATDSTGARSWRRMLTLRPKQLGIAAAALFVLTLVLITGFEVVSGRPVSATVTDKQGSGVSLVGGHTSKPPQSSAPASPTSSPTGTTTSDGVSDTPSATLSDSASASQTSTAPTSDAPSDTPSGSETPSSAPTAPSESVPTSSAPAELETPAPTPAGTGG